jgi:hypothetical protein
MPAGSRVWLEDLWATNGFECMPRDFRRNACR